MTDHGHAVGAGSRPVGFGFLGAGGIARHALAPAVHAAAGARLTAVAARDPERAARLEPDGRCYRDYAAMLEDPRVDVVYVALSNESHRPWTMAALAAGKHVLCEKPLGLDAGQVAEMVAAARAADRLLVEAFWYRWHPRVRRLEHLLAEGATGRIRAMQADFTFQGDFAGTLAGNYRLDPARGGGALYDVGCYGVSAAHLVLGPELVVDAATAVLGPTGVDLATALTAHVPEHDADRSRAGALASVRCGIDGTPCRVLRVEGEEAVLDLTGNEAFTSWHEASELEITAADGERRVEEFGPADPYRLMIEAVAARVRGEDAFVVPLDHSVQVAGTLAAVRAAMAGGAG
jgi:predicted dehydrogenase